MVFGSKGLLSGLALLIGVTVAVPAQSGQPNQIWISQQNRPETEGVPQLTSQEVRATVVSVDPNSEQVEFRVSSGELRTYRISKADQERNRLRVGAVVILTVRDETVIAIRPESVPAEAGTASGSSTTTSGSSTTTIRRETTVQQTRPAPAAEPEPQSVRGLW